MDCLLQTQSRIGRYHKSGGHRNLISCRTSVDEKSSFLKISSFCCVSGTCLGLIWNEKCIHFYEFLTREWPFADMFTKVLSHVSSLQIFEGITARISNRRGEFRGGKKNGLPLSKDSQCYFLLHVDLKSAPFG